MKSADVAVVADVAMMVVVVADVAMMVVVAYVFCL